MKRIDAKWDRIVGDRVFLTTLILAIIFAAITWMAIDSARLVVTVNSEHRVITPESDPAVFWSIVAALSFIAVCCAGAATWRFKTQKAREENTQSSSSG